MRKMFALFVLLFLFGCTTEEDKTFEFAGGIQKIIVTGRGTHAKAKTQEIENAADLNIMENAMQNARILSEPYTNEEMYSLNVEAMPALIELVASYGGIR